MKRFIGPILLALGVGLMAAPAFATTEHCPDHNGHPGKVEAVVDGELDDVVLAEGTSFCVKGSTDATGVLTADGETSLVDYLDNGHAVSYYVVYEPPTTTTTTTTEPPTTTTTEPPVTTTTQPPVTTVPEVPVVAVPEVPVVEAPAPVSAVVEAPVPVTELPYTGAGTVALVGAGLGLMGLGLCLMSASRRRRQTL